MPYLRQSIPPRTRTALGNADHLVSGRRSSSPSQLCEKIPYLGHFLKQLLLSLLYVIRLFKLMSPQIFASGYLSSPEDGQKTRLSESASVDVNFFKIQIKNVGSGLNYFGKVILSTLRKFLKPLNFRNEIPEFLKLRAGYLRLNMCPRLTKPISNLEAGTDHTSYFSFFYTVKFFGE